MKIHAENANPGICQIDFLYKTGLLQFCQNDIFAGISPGMQPGLYVFFPQALRAGRLFLAHILQR